MVSVQIPTADGLGLNEYIALTDDRGTIMGTADAATGDVIERIHYNSTGIAKVYDAADEPVLRSDGRNLGHSQYIPFGYTGMYKESFTGFLHTHFRDYDPIHRTWLSEDPAGYADGLNLNRAYFDVNGADILGLDNSKYLPDQPVLLTQDFAEIDANIHWVVNKNGTLIQVPEVVGINPVLNKFAEGLLHGNFSEKNNIQFYAEGLLHGNFSEKNNIQFYKAAIYASNKLPYYWQGPISASLMEDWYIEQTTGRSTIRSQMWENLPDVAFGIADALKLRTPYRARSNKPVKKNNLSSKPRVQNELADESNLVIPEGRGSTGRQPKNLKEQMAMKTVKANPEAGLPVPVAGGMSDKRWPSSEGWVKLRQNVKKVEIHYLYNTVTQKYDDFKIPTPSNGG